MGWGDEIIASGQARVINLRTGRKVHIVGADGSPRWCDVWEGNPRISKERTGEPLLNAPGHRPYIAAKSFRRWQWREWECPVGEIYFSQWELNFASQFRPEVIIEPWLKSKASPNKDWGRKRWIELVGAFLKAGVQPVQLGSLGTVALPGVKLIHTPGFRTACAVLARAKVAVLPEGGLHHAAAALGVPAVVIFGGFISPKQTGYAKHVNLFTGGEPCGMRIACEHCARAMEEISPELAFNAAMEALRVSAPRHLVP